MALSHHVKNNQKTTLTKQKNKDMPIHTQTEKNEANLLIVPCPRSPRISKLMLCFSTASHMAVLGSPISVTTFASTYEKENYKTNIFI